LVPKKQKLKGIVIGPDQTSSVLTETDVNPAPEKAACGQYGIEETEY
jgi:hypothetical protein